jgi:hypothetical protein
LIANGLPENSDHDRKTDKSDGKSGSGKQVNVPDRTQKDKPRSPRRGLQRGRQTLAARTSAPFFVASFEPVLAPYLKTQRW